MNAKTVSISAALTLAALLVAMLGLQQRPPQTPATRSGSASATAPSNTRFQAPNAAPPSSTRIAANPDNSSGPWAHLFDPANEENCKVAPETLERWINSGRTNVADLLAAHQAGGGSEYLQFALTNFPNDPRVLFAALALNDAPEARRERLDRFKAAAPHNALPDYLSARNHFQNGHPDQAIADLLAAAGKSQFDDYTVDAMQNAEELFLLDGRSLAEAKVLGTSTAVLPHLAQLKALANDLAGLQQDYLASGDTTSAQNLAQIGIQLGEQLTNGQGSLCLINRLVGFAIERIVVQPLDPAVSYDFLQSTPAELLSRLDSQRAAAKENATHVDTWLPTASETDLINYFDRMKLFGEAAAIQWLRQRTGGG